MTINNVDNKPFTVFSNEDFGEITDAVCINHVVYAYTSKAKNVLLWREFGFLHSWNKNFVVVKKDNQLITFDKDHKVVKVEPFEPLS